MNNAMEKTEDILMSADKFSNIMIAVMVLGYIFSLVYSTYLRKKTILVSQDGMYLNINEYREFTSYKDSPDDMGFFTKNFIRGIAVVCASSLGMFPIIWVENPGIGSFISAFLISCFTLAVATKANYYEYENPSLMKKFFVYTPEPFRDSGNYVTNPLNFKLNLKDMESLKDKIKELKTELEKKEVKLEKATGEENEKKIKKHTKALKKLRKEVKDFEMRLQKISTESLTFISERPTPEMYAILKRNAIVQSDALENFAVSEKPKENVSSENTVVQFNENIKEPYHIQLLQGIKENDAFPEEIRREAEDILQTHVLNNKKEAVENVYKDVQLDLKVARDLVEKENQTI